jgi:hypothetical protein
MRRSSFDDAEIFEHIGEQTGGRREFFASDSYTFRRLGKLDDAGFERLTERLRSLKWYRENKAYAQALNRAWKAAHPERVRELKKKSVAHRMKMDRAAQLAMRTRRRKKWREKNPEKVRASGRRVWERRKDRPEVKAAALARAAAHYSATKADPARLEALRQYKREWARAKTAERRREP